MIQFNLLPDIKLATVKANRLKRAVMIISSFIAAACFVVLLVLYLTIDVAQKNHVNTLASQITSATHKLQNTPNLNQILKVQGQVNTLPSLHQAKPVASRLADYIAQVTPSSVTISNLSIDFTKNTINVTGAADSLATVNTYVDTLKFSKYQSTTTSASKDAFPSVVLSSFGYTSQSGATYSITATFDPLIFSGLYPDTVLSVPTQITTRSQIDQPLFKPQPSTASSSSSSSSSSDTNNINSSTQ